MAGFIGRKIVFKWDDEEILGVREKSASCNGEPVDTTSDDDNGWRGVLEDPAEDQVNISISGVTKSDVLKVAWFSRQRTAEASLTYPDGGEISGSFFLSSFSETGSYNDATTFEAELISSGPVIYAPAGDS